MRNRISAAVLFAAAATGALAATPAPAPYSRPVSGPVVPVVPPPSMPAPPVYQPVEFGGIAMDLPAGVEWQELENGPACVRYGGQIAAGGRDSFVFPEGPELFKKELTTAGLRPGGANDLFGAVTAEPDLIISGVITEMQLKTCRPWASIPDYFKGAFTLVVVWGLYSRSQNRVLATVSTPAYQTISTPNSGGYVLLIHNGFAEAMRNMAADPTMRRALQVDMAAQPASLLPIAQPAIALTGSLAAQPRGLSSAVDSVVLVFVPGGHGSGFLVSRDGYLLTDAHVVGDNKTVKVRWSDGVEGEAQLVRLDRGRDVALLKADPRGHAPLPLRQALPGVGETVFAIGAPLDRQLQGTVMRGIVSAHRVQDGYEMIQSDVNINMGMSGGPLLDEQGRVVGLTESKRLADDSRSKELNLSINFFTPVGDALRYLSAAPQ